MNESPGISDALFISAVAFLVVFAVLSLMALLMHFLGWSVSRADGLARRRQNLKESGTGAPDTNASGSSATKEGIEPATVAAITAAVSTIMGQTRFRVADIRPVQDGESRWAGHLPTASSGSKWGKS